MKGKEHLMFGKDKDKEHYKLATFSRRQKPMCLLGKNFQYRLLGEKGCNFIMILSSGEPQPIFSNVAFGPSALRQHWKILALAHHLIMLHCIGGPVESGDCIFKVGESLL